MVNNRLSVTLQNDYRLDRLIELIKLNDKLSIPINQDNCTAAETEEKKNNTPENARFSEITQPCVAHCTFPP